MRISPEMAEHIYKENMALKRQIKALQNDNDYLKKCLYLALRRTGFTLVMNDDFDTERTPEFKLDENIDHELIIRAK